MAYNSDPRTPGVDPQAPNQTHTHVNMPVRESRSSSTMAFIVGGVVVAVIVLYLVFSGMFSSNRSTIGSQAPAGSSSSVIIEAPAAPSSAAPAATTTPAAPTNVAPAEPVVPAPAD